MTSYSDLRPIVCPQCRAKLPAHSNRCDYCGSPLLPASVPGRTRLANQDLLVVRNAVFVVLGAILLITFSIIIVMGVRRFQAKREAYRMLLQEGVPVAAIVTGKTVTHSEDTTTYWVFYHYTASQNGLPREYDATQAVSLNTYDALEAGKPAQVRYAAGNPALSSLESDFAPPNGFENAAMIGLMGFFAVLSIAGAGYGGRKLVHLRWLSQRGVRIEASVLRVWKDNDTEGLPRYHMSFKFTTRNAQGQLVVVKQERSRVYPFGVRQGDLLPVVYLPENPHICEPAAA